MIEINSPYDIIMQLSGNDELKACVMRWERLSENIKQTPIKAPLTLPHMLWSSRSGVGQTTMLRYLSEYLKSRRLVDFCGIKDFFEFTLGYHQGDTAFQELLRFDSTVRKYAGLHASFSGVVCIDVTEWTNHRDDSRFTDFMEYIRNKGADWFIVITADCRDEETLHRLYSYIHSYIRVELIHTSFPESGEMTAYLTRKLSEYGFTLRDDAKEILVEALDEMSKSKIFDGYNTIRQLSQEIAYHIMTGENEISMEITAEEVAFFAADGDYIKLFLESESSRRASIGF